MNTIVALFEDLAHVDGAMRALQSAAVPSERIHVIAAHREAQQSQRDGDHPTGDEGSNDLMMGFAAMSLPSFGPVLASGGLMPPMFRPPREDIIDDLVGAGVPRSDAEDYLDALHGGAVVVLVEAAVGDVDRVAQALAGCGPIEVEHHRRPHAGEPETRQL